MEATVFTDVMLVNPVGILDTFESFFWVDRYSAEGEFEVSTPPSLAMINLLQPGRYLSIKDSEHIMIIEKMEIKSDVELGNKLIVSGRSLESLLDRRIVWDQTILSGSFQNEIVRLLDENVVDPTDTDRAFPYFYSAYSEDTRVTDLTISAQLFGENILNCLKQLCATKQLGFKVVVYAGLKFFLLYYGTDRSTDQTDNPPVIFSPEFDNLSSSDYIHDMLPKKTIALVAGEGEGSSRLKTTSSVEEGAGTGYDRRECMVDGSSISRTTSEGTLDEADYLDQLEELGLESLAEQTEQDTFDAEANVKILYKYGTDFFLGDILEIKNEYDISKKVRVEEIVFVQDGNGERTYPNFTNVV